jgi:HAD superfamily hydrolase (TIGR01549 family)
MNLPSAPLRAQPGHSMLKAIIFDVGGTLLGASDLLENILAHNAGTSSHDDLYHQLGNEFFRQVTECRNGAPFKKVVDMIGTAIEVVNRQNSQCLRSAHAGQVYRKTFVDDSFVIHDADRALEQLCKRGVELIIASDADAELLYPQFEKHKLDGYFSKYFISSELQAYKPSDGFVSALKHAINQYPGEEVILVGDSDVDIETGKKLGIKTARIGRDRQNRYGEDDSIQSLLELLNM